MHWTNDGDDEWTVFPFHPYVLSEAELNAMYDRIKIKFDEACDKIEKEDTEKKIHRMLHDIFGPRTYCIEVARG